MIGAIGAAGGQINCLANGEIVITFPPQDAPALPETLRTIFNSLAASQMASTLPDALSRRDIRETALRLAHHAIVELINDVALSADTNA
jgi:hypothetical protein